VSRSAETGAGSHTVFQVDDHAVLNPITSGRAELGGVAEIKFTGRIEPHENSVFTLVGPGVEAIAGRFDQLVLPAGWRGELSYDERARTVTLRHVHPDRAPAFPGAEGFGKYSLGGRGGRVIEVTNLNDSGPGSLRAAVMAKGPRTVVFRVSGTIALQSELKVREPYLTIAGQTAPGDGICVKGYQFNFDTSHLIIRYLRFRPGDEQGKEQDGFGGQGDHIIIDHCSVSWGVDETFSINKGANLTVQWCMVTESLWHSLHKKGNHGYGGLWGGPGGSWHHNLLAHHTSRNPRASGNAESGLMDFRNNVIYNWGSTRPTAARCGRATGSTITTSQVPPPTTRCARASSSRRIPAERCSPPATTCTASPRSPPTTGRAASISRPTARRPRRPCA
jgi:hypothetical protein